MSNDHFDVAFERDEFDPFEFEAGLEEFFDLLVAKADRGEITWDQVERFFPEEVVQGV